MMIYEIATSARGGLAMTKRKHLFSRDRRILSLCHCEEQGKANGEGLGNFVIARQSRSNPGDSSLCSEQAPQSHNSLITKRLLLRLWRIAMTRFMRMIPIILLFLLSAPETLKADKGMAIRIVPKLLRPGEAFMVVVTPGSSITEVSGEAFGKKLYFVGGEQGYIALSGVDLSVKPGKYPLVIEAGMEKSVRKIRVLKKRFGKEVLHLRPDQVFLSEEDLKRVEKEKQRLDVIWKEELQGRFWDGPFILPVKGKFGSVFGLRRIINDEPRSPHMGQDIKAPEGTPVAACNSGRVVFIDELFFSGKSIIVDHGQGLYSMYFHLSEVLVSQGQEVKRGQVVGRVGATGRAMGPHLHWGVRLQGMRVDPMSLISLPLNSISR